MTIKSDFFSRVTDQCVTKDQQTSVWSKNATIFRARLLIIPHGELWKPYFIHNTEGIKSSKVLYLHFHLVFGVIGIEVSEDTFKDNILTWQCSMYRLQSCESCEISRRKEMDILLTIIL